MCNAKKNIGMIDIDAIKELDQKEYKDIWAEFWFQKLAITRHKKKAD